MEAVEPPYRVDLVVLHVGTPLCCQKQYKEA
jgi:hypothetical protein